VLGARLDLLALTIFAGSLLSLIVSLALLIFDINLSLRAIQDELLRRAVWNRIHRTGLKRGVIRFFRRLLRSLAAPDVRILPEFTGCARHAKLRGHQRTRALALHKFFAHFPALKFYDER